MPYSIRENDDRCPASKPWSVVNERTGDLRGCHPTKESARQQQKALYANVPDAGQNSMSDREVQVAVLREMIEQQENLIRERTNSGFYIHRRGYHSQDKAELIRLRLKLDQIEER